MRVLRPVHALAVLTALALLAACGGGGGGNTPPVTTPSTSNPGGAPPSSTPTPAPGKSADPTATPGSTATPRATATPVGTATPVSTATPSPTPVSTPTPTPASSASPTPRPAPTAYTWELGGAGTTGVTNGEDDQFTTSTYNESGDQHDGDFMPGDAGAMPQGGGQGPVGNTVDGISCDTSMSNVYHVHAFLGLYVNGTQIAIPDAVGIVDSRGEFTDPDGWENQEIYGECFYHIHTHDASGLVHIEDPDPSGVPISGTLYTIGNFFDEWGIEVNSGQFGPFMGPVTVYTSGQSWNGVCSSEKPGSCEIGSNDYSLWTGPLTAIPLYSHEVIWYEVGTGNPDVSHLPGINFDISQ